LHDWLPPSEMQALVDAGRREFRSNPFKPVREAWVIARFASRTNADAARLLRQTTAAPDGEVRSGSQVVAVEVTEAFESWRKPHAEKPGLEHDPVDKWELRFREIEPQLTARIEEKAGKPYAASTTLLVYLNINEWGAWQPQALDAIERLLQRYRDRFGGLHVLWKDQWVSGRSLARYSTRAGFRHCEANAVASHAHPRCSHWCGVGLLRHLLSPRARLRARIDSTQSPHR